MRIAPRTITHLLLASLLTLASGLPAPSTATAAEPALPGVCIGRTDPSTTVVAVANGRGAPLKYVLSVSTDGTGAVTGTMILDQGAGRLLVTQWCRMWLHVPGTTGGGSCADSDVRDDATTAHAVGQGTLANGQAVTVRTDVRGTDEGLFFRVRYRTPDEHHVTDVAVAEHEDECEGGWVRIPAEGWYPLRHLHVGPAD